MVVFVLIKFLCCLGSLFLRGIVAGELSSGSRCLPLIHTSFSHLSFFSPILCG